MYYGTTTRKRGRNHKQVVFLLFIVLVSGFFPLATIAYQMCFLSFPLIKKNNFNVMCTFTWFHTPEKMFIYYLITMVRTTVELKEIRLA